MELVGGALIGVLYAALWSSAIWVDAVFGDGVLSAFWESLGIAAILGAIGLAMGLLAGLTVGFIAAVPGAVLLNRKILTGQPLESVASQARLGGALVTAVAVGTAYLLVAPYLPIPLLWLPPCAMAIVYAWFAFGRYVMRTSGTAESPLASPAGKDEEPRSRLERDLG